MGMGRIRMGFSFEVWVLIVIRTLNLAKSLANFFRSKWRPENKKEDDFSILFDLVLVERIKIFQSKRSLPSS